MLSAHGRTRSSLLLTAALTALVVVFNPTTTGEQLRGMLGIGQDLTFTITTSGGAGYEFAVVQPDGREPVTWDPCREIRYVVNPDGAPAGYTEVVSAAVADVSRATGLEFSYAGTTDDRRFSDRSGPLDSTPAPVLIGWATPEEVPDLAGDVAGVGGAEAAHLERDRLTYVTGVVVLDRDPFSDMGQTLRQAVLTHELGHVVGLDHVDDPGQLMYAETTSRSTLGAGDLDGLAVLGSGPCR
ncbi:matrixin family metalloprotease [Nocardioides sp. SR21]|uniref:matrixin family metalloprotease n=1 Tax=Nocardioides sp. SR21 TaxID=2919501 RepID=UPI001FAB20A5|nr:matrixin family metalloprotease [Nocardioides sp. SR21]